MFKGIRNKLTPKEITYFKLAVWVCLIVWMVFFLINALILASLAGEMATTWYSGNLGGIMRWILPVWIVFTCLLIITLISRWAKRRLS